MCKSWLWALSNRFLALDHKHQFAMLLQDLSMLRITWKHFEILHIFISFFLSTFRFVIQQNRMCISMELVTAVLGDHGQRPKEDYGILIPHFPCHIVVFIDQIISSQCKLENNISAVFLDISFFILRRFYHCVVYYEKIASALTEVDLENFFSPIQGDTLIISEQASDLCFIL